MGCKYLFPVCGLRSFFMVSASLAKCSKIPIISSRTHQHFGNTGKAIPDSYADNARNTGSPFSHAGWSTQLMEQQQSLFIEGHKGSVWDLHTFPVCSYRQCVTYASSARVITNNLSKVQRKAEMEAGTTQCMWVSFSQQCQR